ncbi:hypothetical protein BDC45DRAFT_531361 [Circinella umbellata]|nr:hypothetical protein BDC45DRAFT_531361 [Circinella umbellata]
MSNMHQTISSKDILQQNVNLEETAIAERSQLLTTFCNHQAETNVNGSDNNATKEYATKLEKATNNILEKIKTTPQDYIAAAKIYSYQGKQEQVIDMCQQGLLLLSSSISSSDNNNNCHSILQQELDIAKEKMERRIDFITECPTEVAHTIISFLDVTAAIQAVDTSRNWRHTFLDHKRIWQQFILNGVGKQRKLAQLLKINSDRIEIIYIHAWPDKIKRHLTVSIKKNQFLNLKSLVITDTGDDKIDPDVHLGKALYQTLPTISNTLTRLDIYSQSFVSISLGRILLSCRNLKSLKLDIYSLNDNTQARDSLSSPTGDDFTASPLRNLEISCNRPLACRLIHSALQVILPYIPDLRRLAIYYEAKYDFDLGNILGSISSLNYCTKLEVFKTTLLTRNPEMGDSYGLLFNTQSNQKNKELQEEELQRQQKSHDNGEDNVIDGVLLDDELEESKSSSTISTRTNENIINDDTMELTTTKTSAIASSKLNGLRHVRLHNVNSIIPIGKRLRESHITLETLELQLGIMGLTNTNTQDWGTLSSLLMPNLTTLRLSKFNATFYRTMPAMLSCYPHLETLILEYPMIYDNELIDPEIAVNNNINNKNAHNILLSTSITELPNIKCLVFDSFKELTPIFFETLIEYYRTSTTSKLENLKIKNCTGFSYECLQYIARIQGLKEISLQLNYTPGYYQSQKDSNDHNPSDDNYDVMSYYMEMFTSYLTYDLARPQSLTRLELDNMELTDIGVQNLVELCNRNDTLLQDALIIKDCIGITFKSTELLKSIAKLYQHFDFSESKATLNIPKRKTFIFLQKK